MPHAKQYQSCSLSQVTFQKIAQPTFILNFLPLFLLGSAAPQEILVKELFFVKYC
jgi:hypothetical protein